MTADPRRYSYAYRQARDRLKYRTKKYDWPCWLCGERFDWALDWRDPMAWTADHVTPLARGGEILGTLKPAHRGCNSRRNAGQKEERMPTSKRWI